MKVWLGETLEVPDVHAGHRALIERWVFTFL